MEWSQRFGLASLVGAAILASTAGAQVRLVARESTLVIAHATIVSTVDGSLSPNMTVIVRGDRIATIQSSRAAVPNGTRIDAMGRYLIPGLWDAEVHLSWAGESAFPVLLANGVTSVRDMGGDLRQLTEWSAEIRDGIRSGPSIRSVGPMLNGKSFNQWQLATGSAEEARAIVRTLHFLGATGLNLERRVEREPYFAILDEAKREGIPVGGHVPISVTAREATDAGQATIENAETLLDGKFTTSGDDADIPAAVGPFLASGAADSLFRRFVVNHTAVTPVIHAFEAAVAASDPSSRRDTLDKYVAASQREFYKKTTMAPDELRVMQRILPGLDAIVKRMHVDGVTFLAGTDLAGPRIPGFALHDELERLVEIGLTPLEALQTATLDPATVFHLSDDYGVVAEGKIADLVLLEDNPIRDIRNTRRIAAVVSRGRLYSRDKLDGLLAAGEAWAKTH
jgi:imidazolonepropionase-like amidohydrolase